ncbi:hypothetical protein pb186bvf_007160 [Paramecium bursaria]
MLKKNPNERIQIMVTAKNYDQQGFITFKDLPGSTSQILERDYKFQQSFFPDDQVICCKNTNCHVCKGNYTIFFDEKQKQKVNDLVRQRLSAKLNLLKNKILDTKGINIQNVEDFIQVHSKVIEQQNGRISKHFNKKPTLPLVNLNTIGNAPYISNDLTPGNSSQALTSGVFFNPSQLQIPTPPGGSQTIQKSSLARQSQILKNPQSSIRSKNVILPSININENDEKDLEKQYDAIYQENKEKTFKPGNKKNYLTIKLQNSGTITWPPDIMLQQVETDSKYPIQVNIYPFSPEDKRDVTIPIPEELNEKSVTLKFKLKCTINGKEQFFGPIITCQYQIKYDSFDDKVSTYAKKTIAVLGGNNFSIENQVRELLEKKYELTIDEVISLILSQRNDADTQLSGKLD